MLMLEISNLFNNESNYNFQIFTDGKYLFYNMFGIKFYITD